MRNWFATILVYLILLGLNVGGVNGAELVGSKHDLTSLNQRAGMEAMTGLAFNDYKDPCIYCHLPNYIIDGGEDTLSSSQIPRWNRLTNEDGYQLYSSLSISSLPDELGAESLLCLSCHDGSMAVDTVVNKPSDWGITDEAPMHMRIDSGGGIDKCTQCHDGTTAHKMDSVIIGTDLRDDHPIGLRYAGLTGQDEYFRPGLGTEFSNGIKLFDGKVECATCHNVHDDEISPFLRVEQRRLCQTCHNK